MARAPKVGTQAPYFYRFDFGCAEVTVVSGGPLPIGDPGESFLGVPKEDVRAMLKRNFIDTNNEVLEQNIPVVNFGNRFVMFDTGMGASKMFGPATG